MGSGSGNMWRVVHLDRSFPLGPDVRQWYGDTIGFWDGDALVTWTANVQGWNYQQGWDTAERLGWAECPRPLYPVNGYATPVAPGQVIEYRVPDMFDRPWAQIWEEYLEKNMEKPKEKLDLGFK